MPSSPDFAADLAAIWLTLRLASITTVVLLLIGTPIAWWLARTRSWWKGPVGAVVALPIVLPPTVLGFYLLLVMGPDGAVGRFTEWAGIGLLPFTFWGLGIFPTVSFFLWFVLPYLQNLPFLPRTAILTALIVMTMTWVVMPRLTRLLRGFLNPQLEK